MKHKRALRSCFFPVFFVFLACAGMQQDLPSVTAVSAVETGAPAQSVEHLTGPVQKIPLDMSFRLSQFPILQTGLGVGQITRDARDHASSLDEREKIALSGSFRFAYHDYLFRDVPLAGALGADQIHGWPANDPAAWVQNWRGTGEQANSWGIPSLVLAIHGKKIPEIETPEIETPEIETPESEPDSSLGRTFIVHGAMLDHYGKNDGRGGSNGIIGYGSPRGYEFIYKGKIAQRFDHGLMVIDSEGSSDFIHESPPSLGEELPSDLGVFQNVLTGLEDEVFSAFLTAWKMALDRGIETMVPDGPGQYIAFTETPSVDFPAGIRGVYVQSYNRQNILLVLSDSSALPPFPRLIAAPFLNALLRSSEYYPDGGDDLEALRIRYNGGDDLARSLMNGIALYGIPLTDAMPFVTEDGSLQETQRFSRGWLTAPARTPPED